MNWTAYGTALASLLWASLLWDLLRRPWDRWGAAVGWALARPQLERERSFDRLAELQAQQAARLACRSHSHGLAQYVASPHRGGLPGEEWQPGYGWVSRRG